MTFKPKSNVKAVTSMTKSTVMSMTSKCQVSPLYYNFCFHPYDLINNPRSCQSCYYITTSLSR